MEKKTNTKHPLICPKCKYSRPLGLSYCPHCREQERDRKDPKGAALKQMFTSMWIQVIDADNLPSKNTNENNPKRENTQQKKQQTTNRKSTNKLQSVQRARKRTTAKSKRTGK